MVRIKMPLHLFVLSASNEDDKNNGSTHASEDTWVVFKNPTDANGNTLANATLIYKDAGGTEHKVSLNSEVEVPLDRLSTVKLQAPSNYSGTIKLNEIIRTLDYDEDPSDNTTNGPKDTFNRTLTIDTDPATDGIIVSIAQSKGIEDAGRNADGTVTVQSIDSAMQNPDLAKRPIVLHASVKNARYGWL